MDRNRDFQLGKLERLQKNILYTTLFLVFIGTLTVYSASDILIYRSSQLSSNLKLEAFLGSHLLSVIIGTVIGLVIFYFVSMKFLFQGAKLALVGTVIVLLLLAFFAPFELGVIKSVQISNLTISRWVSIGGMFNIQPSEIARLFLLITLSNLFYKYHKISLQQHGVEPYSVIIEIIIFTLSTICLTIISDLSTGAIMTFICLVFSWLSGWRGFRYLVALILVVLITLLTLLIVVTDLAESYLTFQGQVLWWTASFFLLVTLIILYRNKSRKHIFTSTAVFLFVCGLISWGILKSDRLVTGQKRIKQWTQHRVYPFLETTGFAKNLTDKFHCHCRIRKNYKHQCEAIQSEIALNAIQRGGITGHFLQGGNAKNTLSVAISDFIFAILVEDYGFIGVLVLLFFYFRLLKNIYSLLNEVTDLRYYLFIVASLLVFSVQIIIHFGVNLWIFPNTGQVLPFISKGGTAMISNLAIIAGIIKIIKIQKDQRIRKLGLL